MSQGTKITVRLLILALMAPVAIATASAQDQIPNPGFENWALGNPTGWITNNVPPLIPVTQSSDAHGGSFAVRGEVLPFDRSNHSPEILTAFHVFQADAALTGWYKFAPQAGDVLEIDLTMLAGNARVGSGTLIISIADSVYSRFTMPIVYQPGTATPDSCTVIMYITTPPPLSSVHIGSTMLLDDLAFSVPTGVEMQSLAPNRFDLSQNYPNPFNPSTTIHYSLPFRSQVFLRVFNTLGQQVAMLVWGEQEAGNHEAKFDGTGLPSGAYFYRLEAGDHVATKKFLLLR